MIYLLAIDGTNKSTTVTFARHWAPVSLLNCISLLRNAGTEARLLPRSRVSATAFDDQDTVFVSSSPLDRWQCPSLDVSDFLDLCAEIRDRAELFVLGYHGTVCPEEMLERSGARAVLRGEPEAVVPRLCAGEPLGSIRGLTYREEGKIISNEDAPLCDLASLPIPAYDQVDAADYAYPLVGWQRFMLFESSRGCPYGCTFCAKDVLYGHGFRQKSAGSVLEEIWAARAICGARTGYLFDLNFLSGRRRVERLCDLLTEARLGFRWCCQTRLEDIDADILERMRQAGCELIHCGLEAPEYLGARKFPFGQGASAALDTVRRIEARGIRALCFFQVGFHGSEPTVEDRATFDLVRKTPATFVSIHRFVDYRDPGLVRRIIRSQRAVPAGPLDRNITRALLRFYLRPSRIYRVVTSGSFTDLFRKALFFLEVILRVSDSRRLRPPGQKDG